MAKVNSLRYDEIEVGYKQSFSREIKTGYIKLFRDITGDTNPLHNDENYTKETPFKKRVAYGMLQASLLSTLAGVYIPGERSLILETKVQFKKPVFPGDTLTVTGEVTSKKDFAKILELGVKIKNQDNITTLKGSMLVQVRE